MGGYKCHEANVGGGDESAQECMNESRGMRTSTGSTSECGGVLLGILILFTNIYLPF